MTPTEFGNEVRTKALRLTAEGRDANQTAKILCDADPEGHNYGIGIVLDSDGRAMASSETILRYARQEVEPDLLSISCRVFCPIEFNRQAFMSKNTRLDTIDPPEPPHASGDSLCQLFLQRSQWLQFVDKIFEEASEISWVLTPNNEFLGPQTVL